MKQGYIFSHELVKEELEAKWNKHKNNTMPLAEGARRAYDRAKKMKRWNLLRRKNDPKILKIVSKMTNLDIVLSKLKQTKGLTQAQRKVKKFVSDILPKAKKISATEKEPADFYVIATAIVLEKEREEDVYVVADDDGIADFVNKMSSVIRFLSVNSTNVKVIGYKDFLVKEGLELCLQRAGSNLK